MLFEEVQIGTKVPDGTTFSVYLAEYMFSRKNMLNWYLPVR